MAVVVVGRITAAGVAGARAVVTVVRGGVVAVCMVLAIGLVLELVFVFATVAATVADEAGWVSTFTLLESG